MVMDSTASDKIIPDWLINSDEERLQVTESSHWEVWSHSDVIDCLVQYGACRDFVEAFHFTNASDLFRRVSLDYDGHARRFAMGSVALRRACESLFENFNNSHFIDTDKLQFKGKFPLPQLIPQGQYNVNESSKDPGKAPIVKGRTRRGRPLGSTNKNGFKKKVPTQKKLWEFIRDKLHDPKFCPRIICWEDHDKGIFRFVNSKEIARLWGARRNNKHMTFEKLARAVRYYYNNKQQLMPVAERRLVYKFGPGATDWRCSNPNFAKGG